MRRELKPPLHQGSRVRSRGPFFLGRWNLSSCQQLHRPAGAGKRLKRRDNDTILPTRPGPRKRHRAHVKEAIPTRAGDVRKRARLSGAITIAPGEVRTMMHPPGDGSARPRASTPPTARLQPADQPARRRAPHAGARRGWNGSSTAPPPSRVGWLILIVLIIIISSVCAWAAVSRRLPSVFEKARPASARARARGRRRGRPRGRVYAHTRVYFNLTLVMYSAPPRRTGGKRVPELLLHVLFSAPWRASRPRGRDPRALSPGGRRGRGQSKILISI
eukprot:scaffold3791_cov390-Prasinococcus_capsulatus_cf.AAC.16